MTEIASTKPSTPAVEIQENVIKSEFVEWRELAWLQNGDLKDMPYADRDRLVNSLKRHGKVKSFHVWEDEKGKLWLLDGHHLKSVLSYMEKELKIKLPDKYRADFIKCRDKKHAMELVLVYSAVYTRIDPEGLYEFGVLAGWGADKGKLLQEEINFSNIGLFDFGDDFFSEGVPVVTPENKEKEIGMQETGSECPKCGYKW